jgi:hypothetical protein
VLLDFGQANIPGKWAYTGFNEYGILRSTVTCRRINQHKTIKCNIISVIWNECGIKRLRLTSWWHLGVCLEETWINRERISNYLVMWSQHFKAYTGLFSGWKSFHSYIHYSHPLVPSFVPFTHCSSSVVEM